MQSRLDGFKDASREPDRSVAVRSRPQGGPGCHPQLPVTTAAALSRPATSRKNPAAVRVSVTPGGGFASFQLPEALTVTPAAGEGLPELKRRRLDALRRLDSQFLSPSPQGRRELGNQSVPLVAHVPHRA